MDKNITDKSTEKTPLLSSNVKWVVGTLVGIGTGLARFVTDVRSEFYENINKGPDFREKVAAHGEKLGIIKSERRASLIDTQTFIQKFHHQKNLFTDEINAFTEELGIISNGPNAYIKGTIQRYQMLSENSRNPLIFAAVTTTVIGFAGTSMFMNSIANRHKIDTLAKLPHDRGDSSR